MRDSIASWTGKIAPGQTPFGKIECGFTLRTQPSALNSISDFWALKDVNFGVKKGETLGIIGPNGAGKSTVLKLLAGVTDPTEGNVTVNGRVVALLELGAGFHPELSGRENIYLNAIILGMSKKEVEAKFKEIVNFGELWEFIDTPVKHYSSGMYVRLGFAVAVHIDPEILVMDEVLSVGDMYFQHKCISEMEAFKAEGKTIVLVTHDINLVKGFCEKAILLSDGQVFGNGDPEYVTEQYMMITKQKQTQHATRAFRVSQIMREGSLGPKIQFGSKAGQILSVRVMDKEFKETASFLSGETIVFQVQVRVDPNIKKPRIAFMLRDQRGYSIYGTDTVKLGLQLKLGENLQATVFFTFSPTLSAGSYSFAVRLEEYWTPKINMLLDKQVCVGAFQVNEDKTNFAGVVDLSARAFQDLDRIARECT